MVDIIALARENSPFEDLVNPVSQGLDLLVKAGLIDCGYRIAVVDYLSDVSREFPQDEFLRDLVAREYSPLPGSGLLTARVQVVPGKDPARSIEWICGWYSLRRWAYVVAEELN